MTYIQIFHFVVIIMLFLAILLPGDYHWSAFGYPEDERRFIRVILIVFSILLELGYFIGRIV